MKRLKYITIFLFALALLVSACAGQVQLKGTELGKGPAPNFHLVDQESRVVSLADFHGKVVALTFLYTHCPDVCPLIAERLRTASEQLGSTMNQVAFVAISVDPDNDTPAAIKTFTQAHHLEGRLQFLRGTHEQLQPVWKTYYIYAQMDPQNPSLVAHSTRLVIIDKAGNERVNLSSDFEPADLVYDVRVLVNE